MKTVEQQKNLLHIARTYCGHDVTTAIRQRVDDPEDLETMVRIVNTTYEDDAWDMYCNCEMLRFSSSNEKSRPRPASRSWLP